MSFHEIIQQESRRRTASIAPRYFVHAARTIPLLILAQFLLAGLALFQDAAVWEWHGMIGFLLLVPIVVVLLTALATASVRPLRWWAMAVAVLYWLQIVFIVAGQNSGSGMLQALHPFNGGLLLTAALIVVAKIERSHSG